MTTRPRRRATTALAASQASETFKTPRITERAFQAQVEQYARMMGWLTFHTWNSMRSVAGFPDLVCLRGGELVVAELKSATGKTTEAQEQWLFSFRAVPGATVFVWRPDDASWAEIERMLR